MLFLKSSDYINSPPKGLRPSLRSSYPLRGNLAPYGASESFPLSHSPLTLGFTSVLEDFSQGVGSLMTAKPTHRHPPQKIGRSVLDYGLWITMGEVVVAPPNIKNCQPLVPHGFSLISGFALANKRLMGSLLVKFRRSLSSFLAFARQSGTTPTLD